MGMFAADPTLDVLLRGVLLATIALFWVVLLIRLVGLRSLSKMTPFDFVMTVATGSLLSAAAQASEWSGFAQAMIATASLFATQFVAAVLRNTSDAFEDAIQNQPVFLFRDGSFIEKALEETRVSKGDVYAKMRKANALDLCKVHAVVLETTGDVSVLHGGQPPSREILEDVETRRWERWSLPRDLLPTSTTHLAHKTAVLHRPDRFRRAQVGDFFVPGPCNTCSMSRAPLP